MFPEPPGLSDFHSWETALSNNLLNAAGNEQQMEPEGSHVLTRAVPPATSVERRHVSLFREE